MWIKWHSGKLVLTLTWTRTWSRPGLGPDHGPPWLLQTDWVITRTTRPYLESVLTALQRNPLSVTGPESDPGLTMTRTSNGLALHHRFSPEVPVMEENVERQVFFRWWRPDARQWSCYRTNLVSVHSADVGEEGCCPLVGGVTGTDRHRLVALLTAQTDLLPAQQQTTFKSVFVTWSVIPKLLQ